MNGIGKQVSNPFSTGGGGSQFEAHVQASFVVLMLTGGFAPIMPNWTIKKIKLQGKFIGYDTDDIIIFVENANGRQRRKILGQIKHSINITENDSIFGEVIQAAWNDFNNDKLFRRGYDALVLITGPLSATDINDVRTILEWARHSENAKEYIKKVELARFSSKNKKRKLKAFRTKLQDANGGELITDEILFEFLRHFHLLGYDLDIKAGVTLSLLHSLIGQYSSENVSALWDQIIDEVQSNNKNAGTISLKSLPDELQNAFRRKNYAVIPKELTQGQLPSNDQDWNQIEYASALAIANLIGSWDENNKNDIEIISNLLNEDYNSWIVKIREVLQQPTTPIVLKNGKWKVTKRESLWESLGKRLFDENLDSFKKSIVIVLTEYDPQFELPDEERYTAKLHGKVLKYSTQLRDGLAETLALIGNKPEYLINCSQQKPESVANIAVREILSNTEWVLWASLNYTLPILAEAAPEGFLDAVEHALQISSCPFDELFSQEGDTLFGRNHTTGLLWALETLAWEEQYLVHVCIILGELSARDPGGKWANRPANSLTTIFLPWFPQTIASIDKRKVALQTLQVEVPTVTWKLLLSLLPNHHQVSSGTQKPSWRNIIPKDWKKDVTSSEYWDQVLFYADQVVKIAGYDIEKLTELIDYLDNLPQHSLDDVLENLTSKTILSYPEEERLPLWVGLTRFATKHKKFSEAKWALSSKIISRIEDTAEKIAPTNPYNLHQRLFNEHNYELYDDNRNWKEGRRKLEESRHQAVKDILDYFGIEGIFRFSKNVKFPYIVGDSLGIIGNIEIDKVIFPSLLETENNNLAELVRGYTNSRQSVQGWKWVDDLYKVGWSNLQLVRFLSYLPFTKETWNRVNRWLGNSEKDYWVMTRVDPYEANNDLGTAIDKLIVYGRPNAAISCLYTMLIDNHIIDEPRSYKALLAAVSSKEPSNSMDTYYTVELIKALQKAPDSDLENLFQVEWAYLPLLDRNNGASPHTLENRLASDPDFFCEIIRLIYRSKNESNSENELSEKKKSIVTNAWQLIYEWQTPPGMKSDGGFSGEQFKEWIECIKKQCDESGHLEVALTHVGQVLTHCPVDPDELWIDRTVANVLNAKDMEEMRNGFRTELYNSRGVHWIDPTGKPERELAEDYRKKAEQIENAGFQRLAIKLRDLAETYEREAERIINRSKVNEGEE